VADHRFESIFATSNRDQDNFRARLFGLFSELIVRTWAADDRSPYNDLRRPTVSLPGEARGKTLDFTLQAKDGRLFVSELKGELALDNNAYLRLSGPRQLGHLMGSRAFVRFLDLARSPQAFRVRVGGKERAAAGAILIWGAVAAGGREAVMSEFPFAAVLSLEEMLADLRTWKSKEWLDQVAKLRHWSDGLFDALL